MTRHIPSLAELLVEEHGKMPHFYEYQNCFVKAIEAHYPPQIGKTYTITSEVFNSVEGKFFDKITVYVEVFSSNDNGTMPTAGGVYAPESEDLEIKDGKATGIQIGIDWYISEVKGTAWDMAMNKLCDCFMHELTHAYNDYQGALYGGNRISSSSFKYEKSGQDLYPNSDNSPIGKKSLAVTTLQDFAYFIQRVEQNAWIGGLASELKNIYIQSGKKMSASELYRVALSDKTSVGSNYKAILSNISIFQNEKFRELLPTLDGKENISKLVQRYKELFPRESSKSTITLENIGKLLVKKWNVFDKKFKEKVMKIVGDIIQDNN